MLNCGAARAITASMTGPKRAYRRPVQDSDVQLFLGLIKQRLDAGLGFAGSMIAGYTITRDGKMPEIIGGGGLTK